MSLTDEQLNKMKPEDVAKYQSMPPEVKTKYAQAYNTYDEYVAFYKKCIKVGLDPKKTGDIFCNILTGMLAEMVVKELMNAVNNRPTQTDPIKLTPSS